METKLVGVYAGITHLTYGVDLTDRADFKSKLAFDEQDLWFRNNFDFLMNNWMEQVLDEIAEDISSVDSTNLSEAHSEQISA